MVYKDNVLIAIFPLFIKTHSYGEYVFDWSWAEAYQRHGIDYYPKLLNAIPFTPASGPRWAIDKKQNNNAVLTLISQAVIDEAKRLGASSCHSLFSHIAPSTALKQCHWLQRTGYQYHWFNNGYHHFSDFLAAMTSRKRKNIIKEREKITQQKITLTTKCGADISLNDWENFYWFYQTTYFKRSGRQGYLSPEFFPMIGQTMSEHLVMVQAFHNDSDNAVAAALFFKDSNTLYGRYWGCKENFDSLHFEACYYQGIEYAIEQKLQRFDPGAQGEHKIQRGFRPVKTYSNHWIDHQEFRHALEKFIKAETKEVEHYLVDASQLLPFKKG